MKAPTTSILIAGTIVTLAGCNRDTTSELAPQSHSQPTFNQLAGLDSLYTRASYDATADPSKDLAETVERSSHSGRRIILEIGGDW